MPANPSIMFVWPEMHCPSIKMFLVYTRCRWKASDANNSLNCIRPALRSNSNKTHSPAILPPPPRTRIDPYRICTVVPTPKTVQGNPQPVSTHPHDHSTPLLWHHHHPNKYPHLCQSEPDPPAPPSVVSQYLSNYLPSCSFHSLAPKTPFSISSI